MAKKYVFLDELLESLKLKGTITNYLIDNESGILTDYDIGEKHFTTYTNVHVWHEANDGHPRIKTRRIILQNQIKDFIYDLSKGRRPNFCKSGLYGFIEKEDNLSQEGNCIVRDNAHVYGNAKVCDDAIVYGEAIICGNARVYGKARVYGNAMIYDNARIYDKAEAFGDAKVYGKAQIFGYANIYGYAEVYDNATVYDSARIHTYIRKSTRIFGNARVFGTVYIRDHVLIYDNAKIYDGGTISNSIICKNEIVRNKEFDEKDDVELFRDELLDGMCDRRRLSTITIPQFIRESSKTGNYDFIILVVQYHIFSRHIIQKIPPVCCYDSDGIASGFESNNIELSDELSSILFSCKTKNEYHKAEYKILSKIFGSNSKETAEQKLERCFKNAGGLDKYSSICKLIFDRKDYGEYDILEEFSMFVKVLNEKIRLNNEKLEDIFDSFTKEYINISKKKYHDLKDELFRDLKENYFNIEFINLYNEFSKILDGNKKYLERQENAIEISNTTISENAHIFAPNGVRIGEEQIIDGERQIIRNAYIEPGEYCKNTIVYCPKRRDIFGLRQGEKRALEEVARYAVANNDSFMDNLAISEAIPAIKDTRTWRKRYNSVKRGQDGEERKFLFH